MSICHGQKINVLVIYWDFRGEKGKSHYCKTAQFFYLIFVWELILNTYRGPGYAQFGWSIFFNRRWLLEWCVVVIFQTIGLLQLRLPAV